MAQSAGAWSEHTIVAFDAGDPGIDNLPDLVRDAAGNFYFVRGYYYTDGQYFYIDAIVHKLFFVEGQWNITQVFDITPGDFNSSAAIYNLLPGSQSIYAAANGYCWDCYPYPLQTWNRMYSKYYQLDLSFGADGPMVSDGQGNLYGASHGCGAYGKGAIWEIPYQQRSGTATRVPRSSSFR